MKINKILAAGVAATLAVTSLSAVVSAETKTSSFDLAKTQSENKLDGTEATFLDDNSAIVAPEVGLVTEDAETAAGAVAGLVDDVNTAAAAADGAAVTAAGVTAADRVEDIDQNDDAIAAIAAANAALQAELAKITKDTLNSVAYEALAAAQAQWKTIKEQVASLKDFTLKEGGTQANIDAGNALIDAVRAACASAAVAMDAYKTIELKGISVGNLISEGGELRVTRNAAFTDWDVITAVKLKVTGRPIDSNGQVTKEYDFVVRDGAYSLILDTDYINLPGHVNLNGYKEISAAQILVSYKHDCLTSADYEAHKGQWNTAHDWRDRILINGLDVDNAAGIEAYLATIADANLETFYRALITGTARKDAWYGATDTKKDLYAFLEKTTDQTTIMRQDVKLLSYAAWDRAQTATINDKDKDYNQTYTEDNNRGTAPQYFAGLASQVADFFNKQNNGKIIFKFSPNAPASSDWKSGGVPSTEVGLRNALAGTSMGLFINYDQSTGSLVSMGEVDSEALTITFDISSILDDMGGYTKGNISDIFYGLNKGIAYKSDDYKSIHANVWYASDAANHAIGYIVESVTLEYDDAPAAVDANTDDDAAADDDAAVVVADDDDDDVIADDDDDIAADDDIIEDDDDDDDDAGEIIEDDDDDDDDVNNDVDYVDADDDANPGTGVGLAVIPAIVAGAALVVSKKRK